MLHPGPLAKLLMGAIYEDRLSARYSCLPPPLGSFAQPVWTGIVGVCRPAIPLCPSDISPVNGGTPAPRPPLGSGFRRNDVGAPE